MLQLPEMMALSWGWLLSTGSGLSEMLLDQEYRGQAPEQWTVEIPSRGERPAKLWPAEPPRDLGDGASRCHPLGRVSYTSFSYSVVNLDLAS